MKTLKITEIIPIEREGVEYELEFTVTCSGASPDVYSSWSGWSPGSVNEIEYEKVVDIETGKEITWFDELTDAQLATIEDCLWSKAEATEEAAMEEANEYYPDED